MDVLKERIDKVNDQYFDDLISKKDRDENIARYSAKAQELETRIQALRLSPELNIKDKLTYSLNIIENLGDFFRRASIETKIKLLSSMFPEKIEFDGENYRTAGFNRMLNLIFQETKQLQRPIKNEFPEISGNSRLVPPRRIQQMKQAEIRCYRLQTLSNPLKNYHSNNWYRLGAAGLHRITLHQHAKYFIYHAKNLKNWRALPIFAELDLKPWQYGNSYFFPIRKDRQRHRAPPGPAAFRTWKPHKPAGQVLDICTG